MAEEHQVAEVELIDSSVALEALNRSEIDMQVATAKRYPRQLAKVRKDILELATTDPETAASCFYAIPRDGKVIEGPTVRLAEIVTSAYTNLRVASRVIAIDDKYVTCQGVAHDTERNVLQSSEVKRRITKKNGKRYSDDMIMVTANAACAIAARNAIFKVVPRAFYKKEEDQIRNVGIGMQKDFEHQRVACLQWYKDKGATKKKILALFKETEGVSEIDDLDNMDWDHLRLLRGIASAVHDGETTLEEVFGGQPSPKATASAERAKQALEERNAKANKGAAKSADPVPEAPADPEPEEDPEAPADQQQGTLGQSSDEDADEPCEEYKLLQELANTDKMALDKALVAAKAGPWSMVDPQDSETCARAVTAHQKTTKTE